MDSQKRTLLKALLWQLMGLAVMTLVGVLMTGSATVGGSIAVVNTGLGLITYVIYERVWARIQWGRHAG